MGKKSKKSKKPAIDPRAQILVTLQEDPKHVEEQGSRVVADRLVQVADEHLALAKEDEKALTEFGFGTAWQSEMEKAVADLRAKSTDGGRPLPTSHELNALADAGEKWLSRYLIVVKNSGPVIRKDAPKVSNSTHSPRVIANQIERLAKFVKDNADETKSHGGGLGFAESGEKLADELRAARSEHTVERGAVPVATQDSHLAAGLVYGELVRLARAAGHAVSPARAKLYHLGTLRPSRHAPTAEKAPQDAPAPSGPAAKGPVAKPAT